MFLNFFWLNYPKNCCYFDDITKMKKIKDIEGDSPRSPPYLEEEVDCLNAPNLR
jgi:hypothetical protein